MEIPAAEVHFTHEEIPSKAMSVKEHLNSASSRHTLITVSPRNMTLPRYFLSANIFNVLVSWSSLFQDPSRRMSCVMEVSFNQEVVSIEECLSKNISITEVHRI